MTQWLQRPNFSSTVLALLIALPLSAFIVWYTEPYWKFRPDPSDWFQVDDVRVYDTRVGLSAPMNVARTIKKPFVGIWTTEVGMMTENGSVSTCQSSGVSNYEPTDALPANLTLDWWTYPVTCNLTPGRYVVTTVWTLRIAGNPEMEVRSTSNVFTVR